MNVLKDFELCGKKQKVPFISVIKQGFIIGEETRQEITREDPKSNKIIFPMVRGRDITPYSVPSASVYLIGTHNGYGNVPPVNVGDYPGIRKWLSPFKKQLAARSDKGCTIFNLRDCAYWRLFKHPKIMYQTFQTRPCFIYDENGLFCNNSMWIIPTDEKWLVGLLNSKMGWWLISKHCTQIQNGYQLIWEYLGKIPVPREEDSTTDGIAVLVDRILAAKKADPAADTSALESEIDALVYQLYGLTEEEIKVVEGKDKAAQEAAVTAAAAPAPSRKRSRAAKQAEADEEEDEVLE